ncbi:MAG: hypothetical protein AUH06_01880 [Gemmatimonadetes bacterium 13_2_20CM_69_27]|nr:MAG: hypothetical protein AUH06_01880 [Gemmatimonadetes bacterium 13_2_20CM_69_27]
MAPAPPDVTLEMAGSRYGLSASTMVTRAAVSVWAIWSTRESGRPATRSVTGGGALASFSCRSPQVRTESPFTMVMRSPRRSAPSACAAGGRSLTLTESTRVVAILFGSRVPL